MHCKQCNLDGRRTFNGEVSIHFPGLLDCGFTEFTGPVRELCVLKQGEPVEGAMVFDLSA